MPIFALFKSYDDLWKGLITPPKMRYSLSELGPREFKVKGFEIQRTDYKIRNKNGLIIECSFFQHKNPPQFLMPCVIYLHASGCNRVEALQYMEIIVSQQMNYFCFDFIGCGKSEGQYSSLGWFEQDDIDAIIDFLFSLGTVGKIGLWGRSMGSIAALLYCTRNMNIDCLVADSPFSNFKTLVKDIAKSKVSIPNFLATGAYNLLRNTIKSKVNFDLRELKPIKLADKIKIPGMFGHALNDALIPYQHTKDLYEVYGGPKQLKLFQGEHNSARPVEFVFSVRDFFKKHLFTAKMPSSPKFNNPLAINKGKQVTSKDLRAKQNNEEDHKDMMLFDDSYRNTRYEVNPSQLKYILGITDDNQNDLQNKQINPFVQDETRNIYKADSKILMKQDSSSKLSGIESLTNKYNNQSDYDNEPKYMQEKMYNSEEVQQNFNERAFHKNKPSMEMILDRITYDFAMNLQESTISDIPTIENECDHDFTKNSKENLISQRNPTSNTDSTRSTLSTVKHLESLAYNTKYYQNYQDHSLKSSRNMQKPPSLESSKISQESSLKSSRMMQESYEYFSNIAQENKMENQKNHYENFNQSTIHSSSRLKFSSIIPPNRHSDTISYKINSSQMIASPNNGCNISQCCEKPESKFHGNKTIIGSVNPSSSETVLRIKSIHYMNNTTSAGKIQFPNQNFDYSNKKTYENSIHNLQKNEKNSGTAQFNNSNHFGFNIKSPDNSKLSSPLGNLTKVDLNQLDISILSSPTNRTSYNIDSFISPRQGPNINKFTNSEKVDQPMFENNTSSLIGSPTYNSVSSSYNSIPGYLGPSAIESSGSSTIAGLKLNFDYSCSMASPKEKFTSLIFDKCKNISKCQEKQEYKFYSTSASKEYAKADNEIHRVVLHFGSCNLIDGKKLIRYFDHIYSDCEKQSLKQQFIQNYYYDQFHDKQFYI